MARKSNTINPFNANDLEGARAVIASADDALAFLAKCTACQTNVESLVEQVNAMKDFAKSVIANFGEGAKNA